ncbi:2,3-butanediol dehydrogenase [Pseudonocardia kongjuensis]|uniref:2,3-butanediol dehydrogenase n=1 Tax=Pseudonocardia kongjuensis TaxID=102227 RepID=A0ABN1XR08_9PSEU
MRATRWHGVGDVRLVDEPAPEPGPGAVVLDVRACGICGSDVHAYAEGAWITAGARMGHEYAGTVASVGEGITTLAPGDRVAVIPMGPCGSCTRCREGSTNLCAGPRSSAGGGLAEQVLVPDAEDGKLYRLPDPVTFEEGAFLEPLSVAVRAVRQSGATAGGGPVVVAGLGSIGQCVLRVLAAHGVTDVLGIDVSPPRLERAAETGAAVIDARRTDPVAHVRERWGTSDSPYQPGSGNVAAFVECSGAGPMLAAATALTRAGGTVVLAGLAGHVPPVDVDTVVQKELRLRGSFAYTADDGAEAFRLLTGGAVDVTSLVSHRVPLSRVGEAFAAQHAVDGSVKVVVVPDR